MHSHAERGNDKPTRLGILKQLKLFYSKYTEYLRITMSTERGSDVIKPFAHPSRFVPKVAGKVRMLFSKAQYLSVQMLDFFAALLKLIFHYLPYLGQRLNISAQTLHLIFHVL